MGVWLDASSQMDPSLCLLFFLCGFGLGLYLLFWDKGYTNPYGSCFPLLSYLWLFKHSVEYEI